MINIINDVSGGNFDNKMFLTIKKYDLTYICMHSRGTPDVMLNKEYTTYENNDIINCVINELSEKIVELKNNNVNE